MNDVKLSDKQALKHERTEFLQQLEDWLETPMLILGLIWLALLVVELIWELNSFFEVIGIVIWIIFVVDFVLKFSLAPNKITYLKNNWLTAISLPLPALRVFRIVRIVRILQATRLFVSYKLHADCDYFASLVRSIAVCDRSEPIWSVAVLVMF